MFLEPEKGYRAYKKSLLGLVGHMIGTASIFLALIFLTWLVEVAVDALHKIHPFPADVLDFVRSVEMGVVYVDTALCIVVLGAGFVRFGKDVIGSQR